MKKGFTAVACALFCFAAWAQAPETVGTDYTRPPVHYSDGVKSFVNSDVFFKLRSTDKETGLNYVEFALNGANFMSTKAPSKFLKKAATIFHTAVTTTAATWKCRKRFRL